MHVDQISGALIVVLDAIEAVLGVDLIVLLGLAVAGLVGVIAAAQLHIEIETRTY